MNIFHNTNVQLTQISLVHFLPLPVLNSNDRAATGKE